MPKSLEILYFEWLCSKTNPPSGFTFLLNKLHNYEFVWQISGDDNREEDCLSLRREFFDDLNLEENENFLYEGRHSVLEVLVAFSSRASFATDMPESEWFWIMVQNLGLNQYRDHVCGDEAEIRITNILYKFVWRLYDRKGNGGLFPLRLTNKDQTKVEIWYQFSEYIVENGYI